MYSRLIEFLIDRPKPVLAVVALSAIASLVTLPLINFDFSPEKVYEGAGDWVEFLEEHRGRFRHEDAVLLMVLEATNEEDVLHPSALTWLAEVSEKAKNVVHVQTVESLATLQIPRVSLSSRELNTSPLIAELPVDEDAAELIRYRVDGYELLNDTLLSRDRRFSVAMFIMKTDERELDSMRETVTGLELVTTANPPPIGYQLHMTGIPSIRVDIVRELQADQLIMFPAATGLFLLVLYVMFRSVPVTLVGLASVIVALLWTFALIALTGMPFTLLTNVVPTLLLIIGAANSVHVASRYAEELENTNDVRQATLITTKEMGITCGLTFGTTAIGFGSLMFSQSYVLRSFSMQAFFGLVCAYISVVVFLATLFPMVHKSLQRSYTPADSSRLVGILLSISRMVNRMPRLIVAASLAVIVIAISLAKGLQVNSHMFEMYEDSHPSIKTIKLMEEHLAGVVGLEVSLMTDEPGIFLKPKTYQTVNRFVEKSLAREFVLYAKSYVDIHQTVYAASKRKPVLRTQMPTDDEDGVEQIRRSTALINKLGDSARISMFLNEEGTAARILMRVEDAGSLKSGLMIDEMEDDLKEMFPPGSGITARVTGDAFLHSRCMERFVYEMFFSLLTASAIIFAVISLLFLSIRIGLISALPNLTPLIITLGYMYLRGYDMTVGNVIVFAIGLGIAVDDTIHFLARFREETRAGVPTPDAIRRTLRSSGRAIVLTTVLIVCGLSILLASAFVPTRRFAELTGITMAGALVGDLLLLPACLVLFWKDRRQPENQGQPDEAV